MKSIISNNCKRIFLRSAFFIITLIILVPSFADESVQVIGKYLCINYRPFFPIGLYSFPDRRQDDAIWKEAADAGFNLVLSEQSGKYGIYIAKQIPRKILNGQNVSLMELYRDKLLLDDLKSFLSNNENDSTIICWHAPDEPSYFGPNANSLQLGYEAIRANSKKPVWMNNGPGITNTWHYNLPRNYFRTCDIMSEDIYPIPDGQRKTGQGANEYAYYVGEHTKRLVELGSTDGVPSTPIWMVLQGFGWAEMGGSKNPETFLPPTKHELRYMAYDAIVHGATGLLWYGLRSTKSDVNAQLWKDLKSMASELRDLYTLWTCPFEMLPEKLQISCEDSTKNNQVHCLIKLLDNRVCILAVNTRPMPLKNVTFSVARGGGVLTKVQVLTENRQLQVIDNKSWMDQFEGYGVHIYETDIFFSFMRRYFKDPIAPVTGR